jgi:hypothetical protein
VTFAYDSLSRVLSQTQGANPMGTTGKTVTYSHDLEANLTQVDYYPSGFEAHRSCVFGCWTQTSACGSST